MNEKLTPEQRVIEILKDRLPIDMHHYQYQELAAEILTAQEGGIDIVVSCPDKRAYDKYALDCQGEGIEPLCFDEWKKRFDTSHLTDSVDKGNKTPCNCTDKQAILDFEETAEITKKIVEHYISYNQIARRMRDKFSGEWWKTHKGPTQMPELHNFDDWLEQEGE